MQHKTRHSETRTYGDKSNQHEPILYNNKSGQDWRRADNAVLDKTREAKQDNTRQDNRTQSQDTRRQT